MISNLKSSLTPVINFIARPFSGIDPNILTISGIIPPVIIFILLVTQNHFWALLSFFLLSLDFLDGAVARMVNKVSPFGGFLDSTLDRIADGIIISGFAFAGLVRWEIVIPFLILSFAISYTRSRASEAAFEAGKGEIKFNVGVFQRAERIIFIMIGLFVNLVFPHIEFFTLTIIEIIFIGLVVLSLISFIERVIEAYKKLTPREF